VSPFHITPHYHNTNNTESLEKIAKKVLKDARYRVGGNVKPAITPKIRGIRASNVSNLEIATAMRNSCDNSEYIGDDSSLENESQHNILITNPSEFGNLHIPLRKKQSEQSFSDISGNHLR
jgi:hypothetical protein